MRILIFRDIFILITSAFLRLCSMIIGLLCIQTPVLATFTELALGLCGSIQGPSLKLHYLNFSFGVSMALC